MSFNKKFFTTGGIVASSEGACTADDLNPFTGEVADGGVALYSLDYDASDAGGNYDGTPTDVDFGVGGQVNYGARFNGSSSAIVVPNNILTTNDHSISTWFNLDDTGGIQTVIEFDYENRILFRAVSTDNNKAYIGNSGYFNHGLSFSAGQWYHLVITFSAGNPFKIYVNGVLSYTGGNTNVLAQSNDNIIGASNGSGANGVDGKIDQVRIFSSALTDEQVEDLFEETACVHTSTTDIVGYPASASSDIVAYYKLDNSSEDYYTGGNDGTDTNIEYRFGRFGQAAVFSAGNTGIDTSTTLQSGNNSFSVSLWFSKDVISTNEGLFSTHSSNIAGTREGANLAVHSSKLLLQAYNSGTATGTFGTTVLANDQKWHHVVAVYDGSANTYKAYLNGNTSSADASLSSNISGHEATLKLGRYYQNEADANAFAGKIDQVRIYSTALDSDQIAELYNEKQDYITKDASDPFGDSNSVALYEMENNANDTSGNGNNGTTSNVTFTSTDPIRGTYEATFNGSTNDIGLPQFMGQNNYTFSAWFKTDALNDFQTIFSLNANGSYKKAIFLHSGGTNNIRIFSESDNFYSSDNIYNTNQWYHIVFTKSSTNGIVVYLDANEIINEPTATTNDPLSSEGYDFIGAYRTGGVESLHFDGSIDQVRIFDRVLDGTEAYQLYAEGARGTGL